MEVAGGVSGVILRHADNIGNADSGIITAVLAGSDDSQQLKGRSRNGSSAEPDEAHSGSKRISLDGDPPPWDGFKGISTNGRIPTDDELAEMQRRWGREVAISQAPDGTIRVHYGENAFSVAVPLQYKMIGHTHPSCNGSPSRADINTLKARGQRSSYIVDKNGKRHPYTINTPPGN